MDDMEERFSHCPFCAESWRGRNEGETCPGCNAVIILPNPWIPVVGRVTYHKPLPPMPPESELKVIELSSDPELYVEDYAARRAKLRAAKRKADGAP